MHRKQSLPAEIGSFLRRPERGDVARSIIAFD